MEVSPTYHPKITGHYNTKSFTFTNGLSVRGWLDGQSFEFQYQYGLEFMTENGINFITYH